MDWLSVDVTLKLIKESFTCAICKDHYKTPVIISVCSHNFCSICIRRYFTIKQECPICGVDASSVNLSPNRIVDSISKHFENLSSLLMKKESEMDHTNIQKNISNDVDSNTKLSEPITNENSQNDCFCLENTPTFSLGLKEFCTQSQGFSTSSQPSKPRNTLSIESHDMFVDQSPSVNCKNEEKLSTSIDVNYVCVNPIAKQHVISSGLGSTAIETNPDGGIFERTSADCPVCGISVATAAINLHLDGCLAREEKKKSLRQNTPKRLKRNKPPITKLAYNLLSLRDLRAKMKDIGLPTNGDKSLLKSRHQEFLAKYQAEQDKLEPRCIEVLINELKREEMKKKRLEIRINPIALSSFNVDETCSKKQMHWKKYAQQYNQLEAMARKSLPAKRARKTLALPEDDVKVEKPGQSRVKLPFFQQEKTRHDKESDDICPDSQSSTTSSTDRMLFDMPNEDASLSPELPECPRPHNHVISCKSTDDLKAVIEQDSQSDDIKSYIDASL